MYRKQPVDEFRREVQLAQFIERMSKLLRFRCGLDHAQIVKLQFHYGLFEYVKNNISNLADESDQVILEALNAYLISKNAPGLKITNLG